VQVEKLDEKVLTCYGEKTQILNAPWLHTSNAEYRPDDTKPKKEVVVLLDKVDEKAIKTVAGLLRRWIGGTDGDFAAGILPCPGFQDNKLLFILPSNADIPQTLQTTIAEDMANGRVASLGQRFDLARQLADAVFMLHTANLMHKNLHGGTVLLLLPRRLCTSYQADTRPGLRLLENMGGNRSDSHCLRKHRACRRPGALRLGEL
jgi:hypothetical protein